VAARHDIRHGISAELQADRDDVIAACRRAAAVLGKRARVEASAAKVTVSISPGMSQDLRSLSPVLGIDLRPSGGGRVQVETRVEVHRTIRSRILGFIPAGPKRLVGRYHFFRFLNALETELGALDPVSGSVRRHATQTIVRRHATQTI
jgi:hypothetical protein